jgi:long-chain fatty acid transport protein
MPSIPIRTARFWRAAVVTTSLLFGPATAWGGGAWLYEVASPDLGTASAGRAALASDASTAFGNPAGMTRLEGSQLLFGLQPIVVTTEFDIGTQTTTSGTNGGNAGGFIPAGAIYGVYGLRPDLKLGIAFNSYAGGALTYEGNWVGRYYGTQSELLTFNLNPVIAYRVLDWLSLGAGFSVQYASLKQELAINNVLDSLPDGLMKYNDNNFGFGGNAGVLFEIDSKTRFGITYRSQVDHSFNDVPSFGQVGPGLELILKQAGVIGHSLGIDMTIPQEVMVSGYRDLTDDLAIMANFNWQNWSQFGQIGISLASAPPISRVVNANFSDTYQGAVGLHYRLGKPTGLLLGFAYDSSPSSVANRSPLLPLDQQFRVGVGVHWDVTDDYTLTFAYEYAHLGSNPINQTRGPLAGTLQGDYQTNSLNVFEVTVNHRL